MPFIPHTPEETREMLATVGVRTLDDLFADIPASMRPKSFNLPKGQSEAAICNYFEDMAARNRTSLISFLGAGFYNHYIPKAVDALAGRSEFYTALRLVAGAFCTIAEKDIDAAEDFKVSVTESCLILKNCGFDGAEITLRAGEGVSASVKGLQPGELKAGENDMSLALISALVSSCEIQKSGDAIGAIILKI